MSFLGLSPFRWALVFEIGSALAILPGVMLSPGKFLGALVSDPSQNTAAAQTLTQWFGGITAAAFIPLLLSWPDPESSNDAQVTVRRITYITIGSMEIAIGAVVLNGYIQGDSGLSDGALLSVLGSFGAMVATRATFLFWKPELLEGSGKGTKAL